jgi:hypothetical protein
MEGVKLMESIWKLYKLKMKEEFEEIKKSDKETLVQVLVILSYMFLPALIFWGIILFICSLWRIIHGL